MDGSPSPQDAIIAVASPPGRSPRGMLRLSGPDLRPLTERLLGGPLAERELTRSRLRWPAEDSPFAEHLTLPCLATFFAGPRSFTGEDVLEIQTPGNPALLDRLLHALVDREGLRLAEPGEFTQRAFTAGRIDLTRAEGIAATIGAVSDAQLQAAGLLRRGRLGRWAERLVEDLAQSLALVEAGIDFVDQEDVVPITPADLDGRLAALAGELDQLLDRSRAWSALQSLPWVVLVGRPNVGKSTLFNALLGRERAVTSAMAGTTRDVLTEPLRLSLAGRDVEVMLVDIAGLERADDDLTAAMQTAAADAVQRAELLLILTDGHDRGHTAIPPDRLAAGTPRIIVGAKADAVTHGDAVDLAVSAATGVGLDALRSRIAAPLADRAVSLGGEMLALQPRHTDALRQTRATLREARRMLTPQLDQPDLDDLELLAATLRHALDQLGRLGGRMTPDEVIGRVFATFCVGK